MGRSRNDPQLDWYSPDPRAILPLEAFHLPRRLARTLRAGAFAVTVNQAFDATMGACAAPRGEADRHESWINGPLRALYGALHRQGSAHSVECREAASGVLVGGLYGVSLGGAFFGESMFSTARDASKVALAYLIEILRQAGYTLLDVQYPTPHLAQFGVIEIPRADYLVRLESALRLSPNPSSNFSRVSASVIRTSASGFSVMRSPVSDISNS